MVLWIGFHVGLLLFYLIYLFSSFPQTRTASDQAPQWGGKAKKISERARKIGQRSDPPSDSLSPPFSPLRCPIFPVSPGYKRVRDWTSKKRGGEGASPYNALLCIPLFSIICQFETVKTNVTPTGVAFSNNYSKTACVTAVLFHNTKHLGKHFGGPSIFLDGIWGAFSFK